MNFSLFSRVHPYLSHFAFEKEPARFEAKANNHYCGTILFQNILKNKPNN